MPLCCRRTVLGRTALPLSWAELPGNLTKAHLGWVRWGV